MPASPVNNKCLSKTRNTMRLIGKLPGFSLGASFVVEIAERKKLRRKNMHEEIFIKYKNVISCILFSLIYNLHNSLFHSKH